MGDGQTTRTENVVRTGIVAELPLVTESIVSRILVDNDLLQVTQFTFGAGQTLSEHTSSRAAVAAGARVERAFEILGDDVPAHLLEAGTLRLQYKQASLEELGKHTNPPLTKDAVAGRIRRLLALADKVAHERGIPDTESALTLDMLEED